MGSDEPLDDEGWSARCVARLVELDPLLDPDLARPIADDMCSRPRWRKMAPEDAADAVFHFGTDKPGKPDL